MRPQEGADVAHRQGDLVLGGLPSVIAQLRAASRLEPDDPTTTKLDKLERLVVPSEVETDATVPLLADLLAIPTTG